MRVRHGAATVTGERPSPMTTARSGWKVGGSADPGVRILTAALPATGREHPGEDQQMQRRAGRRLRSLRCRSRFLGAPARASAAGLLMAAAGVVAAACGTSGPSATASAHAAASGSCTGVPGDHHARVVVEVAPGKLVQRCVGFSAKGISALTLLTDSHLEIGTQKYSFGVAVCQVDDVPSHYSQCLPSGQDYWALFLSTDGRRWTSPSVGVSDITVPAGGSLGLRYDPPTGTPAPPPPPSPA